MFDRGGVADVPKTAWQTATFSCQKEPVFGNLILNSLIPGETERQILIGSDV